jgi:polygalacturonase
MPNYITDDTALPAARVDRRPIPPGESETKFTDAAYHNALLQFNEDARDAIQALQTGAAGIVPVFKVTAVPYSATGLGVVDDRAAIQSAIDAATAAGGGVVYFPNGTYLVGQSSTNAWCLRLYSNVTLEGQSRAGVVIKRAAGLGESVRPLATPDVGATVTNITIRNLTVDGNQSDGTIGTFQEHAANIFMTRASRVYIADVTSKNAGGDGIDIHDSNSGDTKDVTIERCWMANNGRYGIVLNGGGQQRIYVRDCTADTNYGDGFHIELSGNGITDLVVEACYFSRTNTVDDYGVGLRGLNTISQSSRIKFVNNRVKGSVLINFCNTVLFAGNTVITDSNVPALVVYQGTSNVTIHGNSLTNSVGNTSDAVVLVQGSAGAGFPDAIKIVANDIFALHGIDGLKINNVNSVEITGNYIKNSDTGTFYGVEVRSATSPGHGATFIANNHIVDFKRAVLVNGDNPVSSLSITGNTFEKVSNANAVACLELDYDNNGIVQKCDVIGNTMVGISTMFSPVGLGTGFPAGPMLIGGNRGDRGIYSCAGTPAGVISENVGAVALRRDGGTGTTQYVKEGNNGTTNGWVAK